MRQIWEGADCAKWVLALDGRTKLCCLLVFALVAISLDNPRALFVLFSLALLLHLAGKTALPKWEILAGLIMLSIWGSMITQALFFQQPERTPLLTIVPAYMPVIGKLTGGIIVYREGLIYGAIQGLRSATMLTMGLFVCWSSDPRQLLGALTAWRMPVQVAFMAVTALRFLPVLAAETGEIITALQLRSTTAVGRGSIWRNLPKIANPLLVRSLRRAQTLSLSVISRGFLNVRLHKRLAWPLWEKLVSLIFLLMAISIVVVKLIYLASIMGYYSENVRFIYDFVRNYL